MSSFNELLKPPRGRLSLNIIPGAGVWNVGAQSGCRGGRRYSCTDAARKLNPDDKDDLNTLRRSSLSEEGKAARAELVQEIINNPSSFKEFQKELRRRRIVTNEGLKECLVDSMIAIVDREKSESDEPAMSHTEATRKTLRTPRKKYMPKSEDSFRWSKKEATKKSAASQGQDAAMAKLQDRMRRKQGDFQTTNLHEIPSNFTPHNEFERKSQGQRRRATMDFGSNGFKGSFVDLSHLSQLSQSFNANVSSVNTNLHQMTQSINENVSSVKSSLKSAFGLAGQTVEENHHYSNESRHFGRFHDIGVIDENTPFRHFNRRHSLASSCPSSGSIDYAVSIRNMNVQALGDDDEDNGDDLLVGFGRKFY